MAAIVGASAIAPAQQGQSYPPDPKRPNNATTCEEALARVREAGLGSPIISAAENRQVFLEALEVAERLCVTRKEQIAK